jgi:transcriptional regulator with XRE-family HTH domain
MNDINIKAVRIGCNLTTKDMAGLMGIKNTSNYTRLEHGRRALTIQQTQTAHIILWANLTGQLPELLAYLKSRPNGAIAPPVPAGTHGR